MQVLNDDSSEARVEVEIPGGKIIKTPKKLTLVDDPEKLYAACLAGEVFDFNSREFGVQPDRPVMRVDDRVCDVRTLAVDGQGLVVCVPHGDNKMAYLYVRSGRISEKWHAATHVLVLPADDPAEWSGGGEGSDQRYGRVMLYVGLATVNRWFRPEF